MSHLPSKNTVLIKTFSAPSSGGDGIPNDTPAPSKENCTDEERIDESDDLTILHLLTKVPQSSSSNAHEIEIL